MKNNGIITSLLMAALAFTAIYYIVDAGNTESDLFAGSRAKSSQEISVKNGDKDSLVEREASSQKVTVEYVAPE